MYLVVVRHFHFFSNEIDNLNRHYSFSSRLLNLSPEKEIKYVSFFKRESTFLLYFIITKIKMNAPTQSEHFISSIEFTKKIPI